MANYLGKIFRDYLTSEGRQYKRQMRAMKSNSDDIQKNLSVMLRNQGHRRRGHHEHREINDIFVPRERLAFNTRNFLVNNLEILRSVIYKKTSEINRNGTSNEKLWVRKCMREFIPPCDNPIHKYQKEKDGTTDGCTQCPNKELPFGQDECGEEFQTNVFKCTDCGAMTRPPDITQKRRINSIVRRRMDINDKTFSQMIFGIGLDIEIHDNGFLVTQFNYSFNKHGKTPSSKSWVQSYRGDPARIRPILSFESGGLGSIYYTCVRIQHRKHTFEQFNIAEVENFATEWPVCKRPMKDDEKIICGLPLQKIEYVLLKYENERSNPVSSFIKGEIQHAQKYSPTTAMGISLIDSLYYPILQLLGQEKWIAEYYLKMRMFKGFMDIPRGGGGTKDKNIQTMFTAEFQKWNQDPWYVPIFSSPVGSKGIQFIRIDDSPKEMQYGENREEGRKQIANAYGISNQFIGDTSVGAGLNNQGLDMAVTNREVKHGQAVMDDQILGPWCASILDIYVEQLEFAIKYNTNEEQDLMAEEQRYSLNIANHTSLQAMGALVGFDTEGKLHASAPRQGEPLVPGEVPQLPEEEEDLSPKGEKDKAGNGQEHPNDEVDNVNRDGTARDKRTQSLQIEGAPNEPKVQGSGLSAKSLEVATESEIERHIEYTRKKNNPIDAIKEIEMQSAVLTSITQQKEYLSFEKAYKNMSEIDKECFDKLTDEQKACVSRKIPIISDEHPEMEQDQVVAIAFSECGASKKEELNKIIASTNFKMNLEELTMHLNKGQPERTFDMLRENDESGISGTGIVGSGFVFRDGTVAFRWDGDKASTNIYNNLDDFKAVHIDPHPGNNTRLIFYEINTEDTSTNPTVEKGKERRFVEEKHNRDTGGRFSSTEAKAVEEKQEASEAKEGNKASKRASAYTNTSKIPQQQCKNCRFIIRTKNSPILLCSKVDGVIQAEGWSKFWKSERKGGEEV